MRSCFACRATTSAIRLRRLRWCGVRESQISPPPLRASPPPLWGRDGRPATVGMPPAPIPSPHHAEGVSSTRRGGAPVEQVGKEPPRLSDIVSELALIGRNDLGPRLETWLDALDVTGRWALLKL